jgi:hypothetical protein
MDEITITIPPTIVSHLLVATSDHISHPNDHARELLADPNQPWPGNSSLVQTARQDHMARRLVLSSYQADASPWNAQLYDLPIADIEQFVRLHEAFTHLVVTSATPPTAHPRHAQAARLLTKTLAQAHHGVPIDLATHQVMGQWQATPHPIESEDFILADDWFAVFFTNQDDTAAGSGGQPTELLRADSVGMARFGLPELAAIHIPPDLIPTAGALLRGLACRLLTEQWAWVATHPDVVAIRSLPSSYTITPEDTHRYRQPLSPTSPAPAPASAHDGVPITLATVETGHSTQLLVQPPVPHSRAPDRWWADTVRHRLPTS